MNTNPLGATTTGGLFGSLSAPQTGLTGTSTSGFAGLGGFGVAKPTALSFGSTAQPVPALAPSNTTTLLPTTGFNLSSAPATISTNFSLASTGSANPPAATTSAGFSLTVTNLPLGNTGTAASTAAEQVNASADGANSVNFAQMDDAIQKWTLELVEQEKLFLNQMDQVRDWDRLLLSTGDKIATLNDGMQKVKLRQQQLDHELDFIVAQQRELAECLEPLEAEFGKISVADPERDSVYQRAENLNTQLQRISEDLKGVIEHINERNRTQDVSDPIVQIGRILNAHMNSLQWVDQNTSIIQQTLDQIGKMRDIHRRDADSTQNL